MSKNLETAEIQRIIKKSLCILSKYNWLIDSYVLDFYVENHWDKLPDTWKNILQHLDPKYLSELLKFENETFPTIVWPLAILALKKSFEQFIIDRQADKIFREPTNNMVNHPKLRNILEKSVKLKKRHEIDCMAKLSYESSIKTGVKHIIDFGAGLGHLARVLSHGYGLNVCCLEMQEKLNEQAVLIDQKLKFNASKYLNSDTMQHFKNPIHVTLKLTKEISSKDFLTKIKVAFKIKDNEEFKFGIIGLHPCGDLAVILTDLFLNCQEAKFLNLVGCCYMKLTDETNSKNPGYPVSSFLKEQINNKLSYEAKEIACHAIEQYEERLRSGNYENLKIHSFRASLEKIIIAKWPDRKHKGLRSVKVTKNLQFRDYCEQAVRNLDIDILEDDFNLIDESQCLSQWKNIVIFYTLRLFFAPLIESVILYDRILYLRENGCDVNIRAIFDPQISPRNHITTANKHEKSSS